MESQGCKSPFSYFGAKLRLAKTIISKLPPHTAWVEVFCGSAAITCAKEPAPIDVINDLDGEVVNVFKQLRDNPKQLLDLITLTPYSREEWNKAKTPLKDDSDVERARKFLISAMMSVNGTLGRTTGGFSFSNSYSRDGSDARVCRWNKMIPRLEKVIQRLKSVRIDNKDAIDIVSDFSDRPNSLLYLDPPYLMERSQKYVVDQLEEKFHVDLLAACNNSLAMILISSYDNPLYDKMLSPNNGWVKTTIITSTRGTRGGDKERQEVLWANKYFAKAAKTKQLPCKLTAKELRENKVNPSRGKRKKRLPTA